jgi:hypothetical protein
MTLNVTSFAPRLAEIPATRLETKVRVSDGAWPKERVGCLRALVGLGEGCVERKELICRAQSTS